MKVAKQYSTQPGDCSASGSSKEEKGVVRA